MQVTANVAVKNVAKTATSTDTPSVKPNGANAEHSTSFAKHSQHLEHKATSDDATADSKAHPHLASAEQPQQPSAEELALQVEQLLAQVANPEEAQLPQEGGLSEEQLQAAMAGQAMLTGQGLPAEPAKADLLEQMQRVIKQQAMPGASAMPLSKEAQQLALSNEALVMAKEPLPLAKGAALPTNEVMLANKDMLASIDSSLAEKLATASLATPTLHVHSAMNSNINMLTQAAMQSSPAAASANASAQQLQASVDITEPEWGRDLVDQLRSRMKLSKTDQIQHAHIRLDPPELGRLEVNLRMEGDKVSVHFTAAHPQLREALAANAERLRFDFDGSQMQLADVSVSSGLYQQSQQQSGADDEPGVMPNNIMAQHEDTASTSAPELDGRYESMV